MIKLHCSNSENTEYSAKVNIIYTELTKLESLPCCELLHAAAMGKMETIPPEQHSLYHQILDLEDASLIQLRNKIDNEKLQQNTKE